MRHSDIFDEFARIAQEQGLLSKATPEQVQKKLEDNPRMDSLDTSAIESLYGVKPDSPKDMQYKRNIVEKAHPKHVVVSPSYDKLNGLVENLNERQDIIINIINKTPDGHLINRKYAEKQLLLTLVRLGNDLDNQKKNELRALADVCLEQTAKITKKAVEPMSTAALVGVIAAPIALTVGAIYLQQHLNFRDEGFQENHKKLVSEIDDMLNSSVSFGVGNQYTQKFTAKLQEFKNKVLDMKAKYDSIVNIIDMIEMPRTGKQLLELARSSEIKSITNAYNLFKEAVNDFIPYINTVESNFKNEIYKIKQVEDKGWLSKLVDWTGVLHGGWALISDDFDDVVRALKPYKTSMEYIVNTLEKAELTRQETKRQVDAVSSRTENVKPEPVSPQSDTDHSEALRRLDEQSTGLGLPPIGT